MLRELEDKILVRLEIGCHTWLKIISTKEDLGFNESEIKYNMNRKQAHQKKKNGKKAIGLKVLIKILCLRNTSDRFITLLIKNGLQKKCIGKWQKKQLNYTIKMIYAFQKR